MAAGLTALIPCKDERLNIRPCIESVRPIADEAGLRARIEADPKDFGARFLAEEDAEEEEGEGSAKHRSEPVNARLRFSSLRLERAAGDGHSQGWDMTYVSDAAYQ